jgi:hypothetical protein
MFPFSALLAARVTISQHHQPTQSEMSTVSMLRRHIRRAALNYTPLQYSMANTDGGLCHGSDLNSRIASHAAVTCRSFLQRHVLCPRRSCESYSNVTVASNTINKAV